MSGINTGVRRNSPTSAAGFGFPACAAATSSANDMTAGSLPDFSSTVEPTFAYGTDNAGNDAPPENRPVVSFGFNQLGVGWSSKNGNGG
ncbi:hypothetical protein Sliba_46530 [Streptomyces nigrescens]|uniref:Uncharacterized protein n=1 Tax=Streptomyces nigrescens TaxID=1920 RepID=A0A640TLZ3_STRNI|nr:hypothetical protein Sliba_46530 [Streptomyces libani subsp. libani]GGW00165.1 hypothetical protein GCM10010500_52630 [Streptomyces libani subsp. libani]